MDVIKAKQVEGAVDTLTNQKIRGTKTFDSQVIYDKSTEAHYITMSRGILFWAQDPTRLDSDGNFRMLVINGSLVTQKFYDGTWNDV